MTIDEAALAAVIEDGFAGDWDIFHDTAVSFLETVEENLKSVREVFAKQDLDGTMRAAHRLKGETSLFHNKSASQIFKKIEEDARKGQLPTADLVSEAEGLTRVLAAELKVILERRIGAAA